MGGSALSHEMRLFTQDMERLYINSEERERFLECARAAPPQVRTLCELFTYTGCRVSEAISLTPYNFELNAHVVVIKTLKRRGFSVRQVPLPAHFCETLDQIHDVRDIQQYFDLRRQPLWQINGVRISRTTAYRWVKKVMEEACIVGACACPKGLRHGYGIRNQQRGVQQHYIQRYMGHSSAQTTTIYTTVVGDDEHDMMEHVW